MGRGRLTPEEVQQLYENPYVQEVKGNQIIFTNDFKRHFMQEYAEAGKGPTQIFREAGFDTRVLGTKRIERAAARWKESYAAGTLGAYPNADKKVDKQKEQIKALKEENKLLKRQIQLLCTIQDLQTKELVE